MNFAHFQGLYDGDRVDPVIVCNIERPLAVALGAKVLRVLLSAETIEKQKRRHAELSSDDYMVLRPALLFGEWRQDGPGSAVILYIDRHCLGTGVRTVVKVTADGRKIFVKSFCRMRDRSYRAELRKPFPILRQHQ